MTDSTPAPPSLPPDDPSVLSVIRAGETVNVPANAPHFFHNAASAPARMLSTCRTELLRP